MRRVLPYALFLILVLIFLWRPIFTGAALLPGEYLARMHPWNTVVKPQQPTPQWNPLQWDAIAQFYPWRVFYARSMLQGQIPLWNPHQFSGTPFLANGQSAVLYPGNLVFLVFDPITGFTVFAALHLFLAMVFTYLLLRDLGCRPLGGIVGAVSFTFSAFMVLWLELPTFVSVATWLPMVILLIHRAVERRSVFHGMAGGLALGFAVLAGHLQIAFYVAFAAGLWWIWRLYETRAREGRLYTLARVVPALLAFTVIAGLMSAPQFLPSTELAAASHRAGPATSKGYEWFLGNALHPYRLVTMFQPRYFGDPSQGTYFLGSAADYMEYGTYCGIFTLVMAVVGIAQLRRRRHAVFFAALLLLSLLTALGTPINLIFYYLAPGIKSMGGPNRILLLYLFAMAVLAAFGVDHFAEHGSERGVLRGKERLIGFWRGLFAVLTVVVLGSVARALASDYLGSLSGNTIKGYESAGYLVLLLASAGLLIARSTNIISGRLFSVMVVALVIADLFAFGINYNPTCPRSKVYPETQLTTKLRELAKDSHIAPINPHWSLYKTPDAVLPPNAAMVYGLYDIQGYDSLYLRSYKDRLGRIEGADPSPPENGNMVLVRGYSRGLARIANYAISTENLAGLPGVSGLVGVWNGVNVYRLSGSGSVRRACYSPYSFRFGLFLMMLGVATLTCGACICVLRKRPGRRIGVCQ